MKRMIKNEKDVVVEFIFCLPQSYSLAASVDLSYVSNPENPSEEFVPMSEQELADYNLAIGKILGCISDQGLTQVDNSRFPQHQSPESYSYYSTFKYNVEGDLRSFYCEFRVSDHADPAPVRISVTKTYDKYTIIVDLNNVGKAIEEAISICNRFKEKVNISVEQENTYINWFEEIAKMLNCDFQYNKQKHGVFLMLKVDGNWFGFSENTLIDKNTFDELYQYVLDEIS